MPRRVCYNRKVGSFSYTIWEKKFSVRILTTRLVPIFFFLFFIYVLCHMQPYGLWQTYQEDNGKIDSPSNK